MSRGLIIGKFLPLHLGHQYLIDEALKEVDELLVLVVVKAGDPYSYTMRKHWLTSLYPQKLEIIPLEENLPSDGTFSDADRGKWIHAIKSMVERIDIIFSSETYMDELANALDAQSRLVDLKRASVPISGTLIRSKPKCYQAFVSDLVAKDILGEE